MADKDKAKEHAKDHAQSKDNAQNPVIVIVGEPDASLPEALRKAISADLDDVLSQTGATIIRAGKDPASLPPAIVSAEIVAVVSGALLNPAPSLIDGLIEPLADFDAVIGPAVPTGCYGVALRGHRKTRADIAQAVAAAVLGHIGVGTFAEQLASKSLGIFVQPPWYMANGTRSLNLCAQHMKALVISGDPEFVAHRTQTELARMHAGEGAPPSA
jgi:hypothetical protein